MELKTEKTFSYQLDRRVSAAKCCGRTFGKTPRCSWVLHQGSIATEAKLYFPKQGAPAAALCPGRAGEGGT